MERKRNKWRERVLQNNPHVMLKWLLVLRAEWETCLKDSFLRGWIGKVFIMWAWGPNCHPQTQSKNGCQVVCSEKLDTRKLRQEDPWGSLASIVESARSRQGRGSVSNKQTTTTKWKQKRQSSFSLSAWPLVSSRCPNGWPHAYAHVGRTNWTQWELINQ